MKQMYKSRLFHRYMTIHRVGRRHGMDRGNKVMDCLQLPSEGSTRNLVTLNYPKGRNFPLDGSSQIPKTPNGFRRNRHFARWLSDLNSVTTDSIDDVHHPPPSVDFSSDNGAVSDGGDSFALLLDAFPQTIKENVNGIILKVDDMHINEVAGNSGQSTDKQRSESSRTKTSLRKRWQRILHKEKERYRRRNRTRLNKRHFDRARPSIGIQWDEALQRKGYCIKRGILEEEEEEQHSESAFNALGMDNVLSEINESHGSSDEISPSPIFRLALNQHQPLIDFETILGSLKSEDDDGAIKRLKVQRVVLDSAMHDEENEEDRKKMHDNAILESISLLIAMRREDWRKYDSSVHLSAETNTRGQKRTDFENEIGAEKEFVEDITNPKEINKNTNKTFQFLRSVVEHKYILTTPVVNLLLAHLLTSDEIDNQEIADSCLQIFEEMKMLGASGQHDCRPDSTTYRLLILAFSRRFQAMGEALKISQEMAEHSSIDISPELFNEALKVCRSKTELNVARELMDSALNNNRIRINTSSCIIFTEMLKTRKLDKEAVDVFNRVRKANLLSNRDKDEYLICLCRWPQRSRRGDVLNLSTFWRNIRDILEQRTLSKETPDIRVWLTFLEGLYSSAKNDESLWQLAADSTRTVLDAYPRHFVGRKLTTIGLDAGSRIEDAQLMSLILRRLANEPIISSNKTIMAENSEKAMRSTKVSFRAIKDALTICLNISDSKSALSIIESMEQIGDPYPVGAKYELYSLGLKCHAKVNDADNAKFGLQMMVENNMRPSEELYSEVLRSMAASRRYEEMEELFQSMKSGEENGIEPGISSYDAIISARVQERSWDDVFSLCDEMKTKEIEPSSSTVKGLIAANNQKGGRESVSAALESLLLSKAQFDESTFRLASEILFQGVDDNLDDFRKNVREIGEGNEDLRDSSLDLVRSIRFAEIESGRPKVAHVSEQDAQHSGDEAWRLATSNLLVFSRAFLESKDGAN